MTLHAVTTHHISCDGTLATACDATHPGRPHTCPATLPVPAGVRVSDVATAAHWTTIYTDPAARRHYCPSHRPALASTASTPSTPGGRTT